jgi:excisionase family DNA binding protein
MSDTTTPQVSPWLTVAEAAAYARCGKKTIYGAVQRGQLRAAKIGNRRDLRILATWVDDWLIASTTPREVRRAG